MAHKRIFKKLDISNLKNTNFICTCCKQKMLDVDDLKDVYITYTNSNKEILVRCKEKDGKLKYIKNYIESEFNRWLISGKLINNTIYYRKICWKCYEKMLNENIDIAKKARKGKYFGYILKNGFKPPKSCMSPNLTFKYLFDISDKELEKARAKLKTASKEYWINKLGIEEGEKRYNEIVKRQAYTASSEYFIKEKGMSEEEVKKYHKNRACTLENFISRYGQEEGHKRWNNYCDVESYVGNKLEYFIEKYGKIIGKQKYLNVCALKANTRDNFINKYGEEQGIKKWNKYILSRGHLAYSNISIRLFNELCEKAIDYKLDLTSAKYATHNGEQCITYLKEFEIKYYYIDFLYKNKIIEFNGDYWHANPKIYDYNYIFNHNNLTAKEIWEKDANRKNIIESQGYKIYTVWENDYRNNPLKIISECFKFLKS